MFLSRALATPTYSFSSPSSPLQSAIRSTLRPSSSYSLPRDGSPLVGEVAQPGQLEQSAGLAVASPSSSLDVPSGSAAPRAEATVQPSPAEGLSGIGDGSMAALRHEIAATLQEARTHARGSEGVLALGVYADPSGRLLLRDATVAGRSYFALLKALLADLLRASGLHLNWFAISVLFGSSSSWYAKLDWLGPAAVFSLNGEASCTFTQKRPDGGSLRGPWQQVHACSTPWFHSSFLTDF